MTDMRQKDQRSKRDLDREGLEVYLVYLLMAARSWLAAGGALLTVYAAALSRISTLAASIAFGFSLLLFMMAVSFKFVQWIAHFAAWIGTRGKQD